MVFKAGEELRRGRHRDDLRLNLDAGDDHALGRRAIDAGLHIAGNLQLLDGADGGADGDGGGGLGNRLGDDFAGAVEQLRRDRPAVVVRDAGDVERRAGGGDLTDDGGGAGDADDRRVDLLNVIPVSAFADVAGQLGIDGDVALIQRLDDDLDLGGSQLNDLAEVADAGQLHFLSACLTDLRKIQFHADGVVGYAGVVGLRDLDADADVLNEGGRVGQQGQIAALKNGQAAGGDFRTGNRERFVAGDGRVVADNVAPHEDRSDQRKDFPAQILGKRVQERARDRINFLLHAGSPSVSASNSCGRRRRA